jgi:GNAT superfamily N-acetyltransferase
MSHDHRNVLGVDSGASARDIQGAFRASSRDAGQVRAYRALTGPHTNMPIEDMMASAGLVLCHADLPVEVNVPFTMRNGALYLDSEVVQPDAPFLYLTDPEGNVLALLQYGWHTNVPPPGRCVTVCLLHVVLEHRKKGLGSILAALAMREAARDGPFTCGGFITNVWARNIHYNLFKRGRRPLTEEEFYPDDGVTGNKVKTGQKAEAIARKYLESLLGL